MVAVAENINKLFSCSDDGTVKICFINNNTLVSGSSDKILRLWHINQTDDSSIVMKKFNSKIISLSYCPYTKQLACGCENGEINLFNLENHNEAPIQIQSAGNPVLSLAFSNDGKILASGNINGIISSVKEFTKGAEQSDDITMLTLKYNGN
ncbi:MAG: hypothetical protein KAT33_07065 [Bacteroidales bacterium]|nr:hypothetical protein [Bacteroidales bacterium]